MLDKKHQAIQQSIQSARTQMQECGCTACQAVLNALGSAHLDRQLNPQQADYERLYGAFADLSQAGAFNDLDSQIHAASIVLRSQRGS